MKKEWLVKTLALNIIFLFILINVAPISESSTLKNMSSIETNSGISLITLKVVGVTGKDNWYGNDNCFTFTNESNEIAEIYYSVDGNWSLYTGPFNVRDGGEHVLEWYAIDKQGNQSEVDGPFHFKVDKASPIISITYEITGGNMIIGYEITFTATATDDMSGMERVEFYLNNVLQETVFGPGPVYQWIISVLNIPKMYIRALAFDKAGNWDFDDIEEPSNIIALKSPSFFPDLDKETNIQSISNNILSSDNVERKNIKLLEKSHSDVFMNEIFDPAYIIVVFNREIGKNNWINSNVSFSIFYESDRIDKVYYQLNNESWKLYTNPINILEDGTYVFSWYAEDFEGNSSLKETTNFNVDLTHPEINLIGQKIAVNKIKFIAEVNDSTSGVDRVRFQSKYCGGLTDYDYPYEWVWIGFLNDKVTATVYDKAGNINRCLVKTWDSLCYSQLNKPPIFKSFVFSYFTKAF